MFRPECSTCFGPCSSHHIEDALGQASVYGDLSHLQAGNAGKLRRLQHYRIPRSKSSSNLPLQGGRSPRELSKAEAGEYGHTLDWELTREMTMQANVWEFKTLQNGCCSLPGSRMTTGIVGNGIGTEPYHSHQKWILHRKWHSVGQTAFMVCLLPSRWTWHNKEGIYKALDSNVPLAVESNACTRCTIVRSAGNSHA